jgi:hypothetical protein
MSFFPWQSSFPEVQILFRRNNKSFAIPKLQNFLDVVFTAATFFVVVLLFFVVVTFPLAVVRPRLVVVTFLAVVLLRGHLPPPQPQITVFIHPRTNDTRACPAARSSVPAAPQSCGPKELTPTTDGTLTVVVPPQFCLATPFSRLQGGCFTVLRTILNVGDPESPRHCPPIPLVGKLHWKLGDIGIPSISAHLAGVIKVTFFSCSVGLISSGSVQPHPSILITAPGAVPMSSSGTLIVGRV